MDFCFLMSSERSGSNLITRLMDGHSRVSGPSPAHLFRVLLEHVDGYGDLTESGNWQELLADAVALADTKLGVWSSAVTVDELATQVPRGSVADLLRYVYEKEAAAWGKDVLFIKENHVHRFFPFLDRAFPGCRFVFLVRDPRDMALSWKRSADLRGCVVRAAETWQADQAAALALEHRLAGTGRVVRVHYEELVGRTPAVLAEVCGLLGLKCEPGMERLELRPSNAANAAASPGWANIARPVMGGNHGKWRTGLSPEEAQFVERTCAVEMPALGYKASFPDAPPLAELRATVEPLELYEKPQHARQPAVARERQAERAAVVRRIAARGVAHH